MPVAGYNITRGDRTSFERGGCRSLVRSRLLSGLSQTYVVWSAQPRKHALYDTIDPLKTSASLSVSDAVRHAQRMMEVVSDGEQENGS